ncbi:MAG: hypothetical protein HY924_04900 [Elusimicrobia bacterium]|nr:hypothetical protein [Elusimicrobiota bacterium]
MTPAVRRWRREFLRAALLEAFFRLTLWPCAAAFGLLLLDHAFSLPMAWRLGSLILGIGAWACAAAVLVAVPLLRRDQGGILSAAESRFPAIRPYLKSSWDLRERPSPHTSEELRLAHLAEAERRLAALPEENLFPWKPSAWVRSGAVAGLAAALCAAPFSDRSAWSRLLAPWNDAPLESFVSVSPGDRVCEWGSSVAVSARWTGRPKPGGDLRLWLKGQGLPWRRASWDEAGRGSGLRLIQELVAPLEYRVTWKDLSSRVYRLTPSRPPGWDLLRATVRSPQGVVTTGPLSPAEPLSAYRGSRVTVEGEPTEPLAAAALRFEGGASAATMRPAEDGAGLRCGFIVTEDAVFRFELTTRDGRTDPSPEAYRVTALTDAPPKAELLSPTVPMQASRHDVLAVSYSASDDLGLSRVSFRVRVAGERSPAPPVVLREFGARSGGAKETMGEHAWSLADLPHGAKAEFWIEAADDAPRPQTAVSARGSVEIVDFESAHLEAVQRATSAQNNLLSLAKAHAGVLDLMERLSSSSVRDAGLADLERRLSGLPGAWNITSASVADLASSMGKDAYANPALADGMSSLADELAAAGKDALPPAVEAARQRDWDQARKLHRRLASRLASALNAFQEARRLQSLQDFHAFSSRMARSAESLEAEIDAARRAGDAAARSQAAAKLRDSLERLRGLMSQFAKDLSGLTMAAGGGSGAREIAVPLLSAVAAASAIEAAIQAGDFETAASLARKLADDLARMQKAIGEAAASAMASSGASPELEEARSLWSEAVEEQSRSLSAGREAGRKAMDALRRDQKALLAELAGLQKVAVSSASAWGAQGRAFPAGALSEMKTALAELESGQAGATPGRLTAASAALRSAARQAGAEGADLESFARTEDDIRRRLESAPKTPPAAPGDALSRAAAASQAGARSTAGRLQAKLEGVSAMARLPSGSIERVEAAQGQQSSAQEALERGDAAAALAPQEEALRLLEQGLSDLDRAIESQRQGQTMLSESFSNPAATMRQGRGGRTGADTGFVPLPRARDYAPPRAIRSELERSVKEKRPKAMDGTIKEYFKRIAQ